GAGGLGCSYAEVGGGDVGAVAVLAARGRRGRTGEGALIDLAQQEAVASLLGPVLLDRAVHGGSSLPFGNRSQEGPGAPHGVYPCAGDDRWIAIAVFDDDAWRSLARAAGDPPWARDGRFATRAGRAAHAAALAALLPAP